MVEKTEFYIKVKKKLKVIMVILHAMRSVLKIQERIWQPLMSVGFKLLKSIMLMMMYDPHFENKFYCSNHHSNTKTISTKFHEKRLSSS